MTYLATSININKQSSAQDSSLRCLLEFNNGGEEFIAALLPPYVSINAKRPSAREHVIAADITGYL